MDEEISTHTSVDVLIERLKTHPDEFYNRAAISTYDGAKVFSGVKWRRIIVTLMTDTPSTAGDNLWLNLFSEDEKQRFRAAMYSTLRGELDGQVMRAMVTGNALDYDAEKDALEVQKKIMQNSIHAQKLAMQQAYANQQNSIGQTMAAQGTLTVCYGMTGATANQTLAKRRGLLDSVSDYLKEWDVK